MSIDVKPNFKQAEQLIKEAMKNPETKDLADTWDVAGFIQRRINEEQMKNASLISCSACLKLGFTSLAILFASFTFFICANEKLTAINKTIENNTLFMIVV